MSTPTENLSLRVCTSIDNKPISLYSNAQTSNGEPQIQLAMSDGTAIRITHVTHNLRPYNAYYTVKHYANEADIIAKKYRATNNEKCSFVFPTLDQLEAGLTRYLNKIRTEDNIAIIPGQKGVQQL